MKRTIIAMLTSAVLLIAPAFAQDTQARPAQGEREGPHQSGRQRRFPHQGGSEKAEGRRQESERGHPPRGKGGVVAGGKRRRSPRSKTSSARTSPSSGKTSKNKSSVYFRSAPAPRTQHRTATVRGSKTRVRNSRCRPHSQCVVFFITFCCYGQWVPGKRGNRPRTTAWVVPPCRRVRA